MNIFERTFLTIYTFILSLLSVFMMVLPFDILDIYTIFDDEFYLDKMDENYIITFIGIVLFILSIRILFSGFSKGYKKNAFIYPTNYGEIKITNKTIEGLVKGVTSDMIGISNISTKIKFINNGIYIDLKGLINQSTNIPDTAASIQEEVKDYIENYTGLEVIKIKVEINNISPSKKVLN